jgi:hypothetical protein
VQLSARLTDPQAKLLSDLLAWLFPSRGFRLEAVVHQSPAAEPRVGVTAKLIRLGFWIPRERVIASIIFWEVDGGPAHEPLARLTATWAEWYVA